MLAEKVMTRLGYTPDMIAIAGPDAYNYQGVGCPHHHAGISPGTAAEVCQRLILVCR